MQEVGQLTVVQQEQTVAQLIRPNLIEEIRTDSGGIRQDFVVPTAPHGDGPLQLQLNMSQAAITNAAMITPNFYWMVAVN